MNRFWKRQQPTSLRHAMDLCKDHARERHNLSVERIAERLHLNDHYALYKWLSSGRMPAAVIPAYEAICGAHFITRYLASSAEHLLIPMPTGRQADPDDMQQLQGLLHAAAGAILDFYAGRRDVEQALADIRTGMEALGWHHANIRLHHTPELAFGGEA